MAERFAEALGKQLFIWSGWVFTVGGAIGSFVLGQAYAWIGWLFVAVGLLALTAHAVALHRRVREFEAANRNLTEQAAEADRRLNAVPMAVMEQLVGLVSGGVSVRMVEAVVEQIRRIERIRKFVQLEAKPLNPRTFTKEAGRLYAVAKLASQEQAAVLMEGDLFALVRRGGNGISVDCARLRVHQPPKDGTVVFEVYDPTGGEMTALSQLAETREVAGITGYFIQPYLDVTKYPEFDADQLAAVIRLVIQELDPNAGGPT